MRELNIEQDAFNQRLDKYLLKYLNKAPKSFVYKMLRKKNIKINAKKAVGNEILNIGDVVTLFLSEETILSFMEEKTLKENANKKINIIYEDENVLVVNKDSGLLSHPEKSSDSDTLIDRLLYYLYEKGEYDISNESTFTPAICNRLDRNTSGVIICGKNLISVQTLNKIFQDNKVEKIYVTIVKGRITESGELRGFHIKDSYSNEVIISDSDNPNAKLVITQYSPIKATNLHTLLEINLITGKSHQIRAHLKSIGHNILGDAKYGDPQENLLLKSKFRVSHQLLHAEKLVIEEENGYLDYLYGREFIAPVPEIFNRVYNYYF